MALCVPFDYQRGDPRCGAAARSARRQDVRAAGLVCGGDRQLRLLHTEQMDNRDPAVEKWFETYENPQKALVQAVRQVILNVEPRISETIKWKAPTFMFSGNIASFYPRTTKHVSLMFHTGAVLPDPTGL